MDHVAITSPLTSNGFTLSTAHERLGGLEPTDPTRPMSELREQYAFQGYLWLKGILPRKEVLEFRARFFSTFREANLIAPESDPVEGIYSGGPVNSDLARKILMEVVRWAEYEAFCLLLPIRRFYEDFFGGAPYLHKRKIIRYSIPGDSRATGAHYDLVYLRGGTDNLCTSWIPIGDIPVQQGGLIYLEGSAAWARELEAEYSRRNQHLPYDQRISAYNQNLIGGWLSKDLPTLADQLNTRWLIADYEAGDMVVHSPYIVHAATANFDPTRRMRLSTDIRYQRVRDEIDIRWQNHWSLDDML